MTRPDLIRFLQRQRLAVISSLGPDAAPQSDFTVSPEPLIVEFRFPRRA